MGPTEIATVRDLLAPSEARDHCCPWESEHIIPVALLARGGRPLLRWRGDLRHVILRCRHPELIPAREAVVDAAEAILSEVLDPALGAGPIPSRSDGRTIATWPTSSEVPSADRWPALTKV